AGEEERVDLSGCYRPGPDHRHGRVRAVHEEASEARLVAELLEERQERGHGTRPAPRGRFEGSRLHLEFTGRLEESSLGLGQKSCSEISSIP
ncbi:hypothetical protein THAOC_22327, partial [Thalassiosira oceanica]